MIVDNIKLSIDNRVFKVFRNNKETEPILTMKPKMDADIPTYNVSYDELLRLPLFKEDTFYIMDFITKAGGKLLITKNREW